MREPWFGARDEACVSTILLLAAQGKMKEAWALEMRREKRIAWELEQSEQARAAENSHGVPGGAG